MGLAHSPKIVTDGLVFYYDMNNYQKSWKGKPTTNFFTNGHFSGGQGITQESGSNATNTVIYFPRNPGDTNYVLEQSMGIGQTEYQINLTTELTSSTTYVMSGWYAESPDYSCADGSRMFHSRAFSTSGAHQSLGIGIGTVIETKIIDGITWKYCYATITTPADYSNDFNWYVGYGGNDYTGKRYYTNLQIEQGSYPSRFVNGTRSNTQTIYDLTNKNIVTASSLTYNNDDTFSFNGSSNLITFPENSLLNSQEHSVEVWVKTNSTTQNGFWFEKGNVNSQYSLFQEGSVIQWRHRYTDGVLDSQSTTTATYLNTTNWAHVVGTYGGGLKRTYINGVLVNSKSESRTVSTNTNGCSIGVYGGANGSRSYWYNGSIGIVKVYNKSLTDIEIQQNFNATRGRYGL